MKPIPDISKITLLQTIETVFLILIFLEIAQQGFLRAFSDMITGMLLLIVIGCLEGFEKGLSSTYPPPERS